MAQKKKHQVFRRWFRATGFWISIVLSFIVLFFYVFSRPVFDPEEKIKLFGLKDILEVIEAEPAIKGDTVSNITKEVKLQTGLVVKTPPFVKIGDKVKVDTRTGEYLERAN